MENVLSFVGLGFTGLYGIAGLFLIGTAVYWLFNKKAKQRQLAELRAQLDELAPTDPEYNQVRALYTAMMIDAHRGEFSDAINGGGDGGSHHADGGSHSDGGDSDGGGSDGGSAD